MLFTLFFVGLLASAAVGQRQGRPISFAPGQMYVYEYNARLLTGIPELADQYSGFELTCNLLIQPRDSGLIAMKMTDIKIGKTNDQVPGTYEEDIDMVHRFNKEYQRELTKPIRFGHEFGKVKFFEADRNEPDWSLNIKKSILSLFNINLTPEKVIRSPKGNLVPKPISFKDLKYYGVYERSIAGICETLYEVDQIPNPKDKNPDRAFVLNVTKTRNFDNCLTEPSMVNENFDLRGCPAVCRKEKSYSVVKGYIPIPDTVTDPYMTACQCGHEPNASPVDQFNFVKYNISLVGSVPIIQGCHSEGKVIFNHNGDKIMVVTHQNVTLHKLLPARAISMPVLTAAKRHEELAFRIPKPTIPAGPKRQLDIPYYALFGQPNVPELAENVPLLLDNLAQEIVAVELSASKDSMYRVIQIVNTLAVMPSEALEALYKEVAQPGREEDAAPKVQVIRKLFLDCLALAGSNQAALFAKQLIVSNLVSTLEAKELVEAIPQNMFLPDVSTIDEYFNLCQNPKIANRRHLKASVCIAFGKMVREGCVKPHIAPGDLPDSHIVPHSKRNLPAQMVIKPADPQQAHVTVLNMPIAQAQRQLIRQRRSAPWEAAYTQQVCEEQDIRKYVQAMERVLDEANTYHSKVIAIETLAHMSVPHALPALAPYITGSVSPLKCPGYPVENKIDEHEECNFVRTAAIYALTHIIEYAPKQCLPLVLPVYRNIREPYELRIAAFTALLLADPETQVLESIASELHRENNKQVRSYVASALETVANLTQPCFRSVADSCDDASDAAPEAEFGMQYSKFLGMDFFDEDKNFGMWSIGEWVANNLSWVPRAGYFDLGQTNGPFHDQLIQFGFSAKGMEAVIRRISEPHGLLSDMLEGMNAKRERRLQKRNTDSVEQALEALKEKLNFKPRTDDHPKANIFFKLFDRTSYYALDEKHMMEIIDQAEDVLRDWAQELLDGYTGHFVKVFMPASMYRVVPSQLGLPIVISHKHPIILSLKVDNAKLELTTHPRTPYPVGFNLTALIQPKIMYSSLTFVFGVSPAYRVAYGTHIEKTTQVTLPIEIAIGHVRPKSLWTISLTPDTPKEIVYHKCEAKTFISRAKIASAPTRDWLEDSHTINTMPAPFHVEKKMGHDLLGMGLRVQFNSEDEWHMKPFWSTETAKEHGMAAALVDLFRNPGLKPRELHVALTTDDETPTTGVDLTFRYKWTADEENISDLDDSDESSASDESDSDNSDESSSSQSSESSDSDSSESNSSKNSSGKSSSSKSASSDSKSESNSSSDTSEESDSDSTGSKSNSDENSSSSSSESASSAEKAIRKMRKLKHIRKSTSSGSSSSSSSESASKSGSSSSSSSDSSEESKDSSSSSASISGNKAERVHKARKHIHISASSASSASSDSSSSSEESASSPESSSQSSSSESSSSSSSSSSSESDESMSLEDLVFDYEDVMELITGHSVNEHNIKRVAMHLIKKTRDSWIWAWDDDESAESSSESDDSDSSSSDQSASNSDEKDIVPAFETHNLVITVTARGPRPSYLAMNLMLVQSFDKRTMWVKADGHIKTPVGIYMEIPTLFCADAVAAFPRLPGEFYFDATNQEDARAKVKAELGWGPQCHTEGGIIVTGIMEKTKDQVWKMEDFSVQDGATDLHMKDWFYHQCATDRSEGKSASYACERAIIKESYFNQLTLDIKYKNVPREIQNLTRKLDLALKVGLYENMDNNDLDVDNVDDQLRLVAQYSGKVPDVPMMNLFIQKPNEETKFEKVHTPFFRPPSTFLPMSEVLMNLITGYENTPSCALMEKAVRTFDNVTIDLPETPCQILVAMDCSPQERFAVYSKELDPETKDKKVTVITAGKEIKLLPPQQQDLMQIQVDGQSHELSPDHPVSYCGSKDCVRVYLRKPSSDAVAPICVIENPDDDVTILYDGKNVKVLLGTGYEGQTCGVCGDNNNEVHREMVGPGLCLYEKQEDFVNSYSMAGEHCEQKPVPLGKVRCPKTVRMPVDKRFQKRTRIEVQTRQNPTGSTTVVNRRTVVPTPRKIQAAVQNLVRDNVRHQANQCQLRTRTEYLTEGNMVCFTTRPVGVCGQTCRIASQSKRNVQFHCLPKESAFTRQLMVEAQKAVLKQLINKRVDLQRELLLPTACAFAA